MTIKERLFVALKRQGYDFLGACTEATRIIREAKALEPGRRLVVEIAGEVFTIQRGA